MECYQCAWQIREAFSDYLQYFSDSWTEAATAEAEGDEAATAEAEGDEAAEAET